jgi:prepilin-type processing-associated H-X9-DG protein
MSRRSVRRAATRLELLVLVGGVVVLLALLTPGIRVGGETARRTQCSNNLHNIVLCLQQYHDVHKMYPMGAMHAGLNPGGDPPINAGLGPSWWYGMLPFTEHRTTYDMIDRTQQAGQPAYPFSAIPLDFDKAGNPNRAGTNGALAEMYPEYMRCPSSSLARCQTSTGPICLPSYVGIAGGCDIDPKSQDYQVNGTVARGLVAPKTKRVYHNKFKGTGAAAGGIVTSSGMLPACQQVSIADCTDGTSNTMIVAEQSDWLHGIDIEDTTERPGEASWTVGGTGRDGRWRSGTGRGGGWLSGTTRVDPVPQVDTPGGPPAIWGADCWNITTVRYPPNLKRVIGNPPLPGCSDNHGINNPLQSAHPGGLQVGMADGSVQFVSEKTELAVLLRLAIRDDLGSDRDPEK